MVAWGLVAAMCSITWSSSAEPPDRRSASYRTKLCFPFHWTDLVSALHVFAATGLSVGRTNTAATVMSGFAAINALTDV